MSNVKVYSVSFTYPADSIIPYIVADSEEAAYEGAKKVLENIEGAVIVRVSAAEVAAKTTTDNVSQTVN